MRRPPAQLLQPAQLLSLKALQLLRAEGELAARLVKLKERPGGRAPLSPLSRRRRP